MRVELLEFENALRRLNTPDRAPHLLLGNGFSRAWRDDVFAYGSLFERADLSSVSSAVRAVFDAIKTQNFEVVMQGLHRAAGVLEVYDPSEVGLIEQLRTDAEGLKEILVRTIAGSHPDRPGAVSEEEYRCCRDFLSPFNKIYTVNYDLLLYWTVMQEEIEPEVTSDDGFRRPEDGEEAYVTWEPDRHSQDLYYLHGALHVFDAGTEIQKYTWVNTGVPLIEQIRDAMDRNLFPLFVSEGASEEKFRRIRHNAYLFRGERSLLSIRGALFVFGMSFGESDAHILRFLRRSNIDQLFVSMFGDPNSEGNRTLRRRVEELRASRSPQRPLECHFYRAGSARVWR